jgi:hypothetical protein
MHTAFERRSLCMTEARFEAPVNLTVSGINFSHQV